MARFFAAPEPGDIVYCRFPENRLPKPGPKPRPALVLAVGNIADACHVTVAYGTSQKTDQLFSGEFLICEADGDAYTAAGLSYATKFDLRVTVDLPYNDEWFRVPNNAPHGQTPRLGFLHANLMRRAQAAARSAAKPR